MEEISLHITIRIYTNQDKTLKNPLNQAKVETEA